MEDLNKQRILDFIKQQKLCVISTTGERGPESAVVAFGENENFEIYFGTSNTSRKYANLKKNPRAAFVIGWDDEAHMSVQYEGIAKELDGTDAEHYQAKFVTKNPRTARFLSRPDQRYFLVTPTWIRWISGPENLEISFPAT